MTAEDDGPMDDPYCLDLPRGWTANTDGETTTYERPDGTLRIEITEFSRGLSLYWWVDVYERNGDDWTQIEVGLGASFTSADDAAAAVQSYLDENERSGESPQREQLGVESR
ncbi:hypothetical protein G3I44_15495 [Halogeometricum borinquense]|uniref:Uncharacterized protein n=1 Tax=Halogeometricum borinquense TaxID=60847 RepID=A0A6C0UJA9_9EURY|nr:hypothetical protein [Halogeometricum borinquense]QIB75572.1 hypothetical protein G3I44_15495 [Halogeometricum borinquense]